MPSAQNGRISSVPPGWKVQHAVPPHPGPLPWGEGELSAAHSKTQRLPHYRALEMVHPLPEGEGWGEGEEGARPRINRWCCQGAAAQNQPTERALVSGLRSTLFS